MRTGPPRWRASTPDSPIDWPRTLVAKGPGALRREHLQRRPDRSPVARLHLVALDCSGSMRRGGRLASAKGHAAALIDAARRAGDDVALLSFGGGGIEWVLRPREVRRASVDKLRSVGGGGGTPLAAALAEVGRVSRARRGGAERWLWLLTDGRSLEQPVAPVAEHVVIVDFDSTPAIGRCAEWAARWGAEHRSPRS